MAFRPRERIFVQPRQMMRPIYEKFKPKSEWKFEDDAAILLVYLPGFVMEQIRVMFTYIDPITLAIKIQGQRPLAAGRWSQFTEIYRIPENCDVSKINSKFEGGVLTVVVPKVVEAQKGSDDKQEGKATQEIPSPQESEGQATSSQKVAETSAIEKRREDENVEAVTPQKEKSEENSQKGQDETAQRSASLVDTQKKIDENGVEGESANQKADEKSQKSQEEASPRTTALVDSEKQIHEKRLGPGGETADEGKGDEKYQEGQNKASPKAAESIDTVEQIDGKRVGQGGESDFGEIDEKSEKGDGKDEASPKTAALVDIGKRSDERKVRSDDKSAYKKADEKNEKLKANETKEAVEADQKPESSAEKSKEYLAAMEAAAVLSPKAEEKENSDHKSVKSVDDHLEDKENSIAGKSKYMKDNKSAADDSKEGKLLLLNMGTAVLVIMGLGAYMYLTLLAHLGKA